MSRSVLRDSSTLAWSCFVAIALSSCSARPPLRSTKLPNTIIYASTQQELEVAEQIIADVPLGIPSVLLLDDSVPIEVRIMESASQESYRRPGIMTEVPFIETKTIRVYGSAWRSILGHEVFHAYSSHSLKGVPQFIQEGMADWFGSRTESRNPEMRLQRWTTLLEEKRTGFLNLENQSPSTQTQLGRLVSEGQPFESSRRLSLDELIEHSSWSIRRLDPDQSNYLYAIGFAMVEDIATDRPQLLVAETLRRRDDETAEAYFDRLGLPSLSELRARAHPIVDSASPTRVFWLSLRRRLDDFIRRDGADFRDRTEFMERFRASINYRGERHELLTDPEFLQLVEQHWTLVRGSEGTVTTK